MLFYFPTRGQAGPPQAPFGSTTTPPRYPLKRGAEARLGVHCAKRASRAASAWKSSRKQCLDEMLRLSRRSIIVSMPLNAKNWLHLELYDGLYARIKIGNERACNCTVVCGTDNRMKEKRVPPLNNRTKPPEEYPNLSHRHILSSGATCFSQCTTIALLEGTSPTQVLHVGTCHNTHTACSLTTSLIKGPSTYASGNPRCVVLPLSSQAIFVGLPCPQRLRS